MADSTYDAARYKRSGRGKIFDSVIDLIGDTPIGVSRKELVDIQLKNERAKLSASLG